MSTSDKEQKCEECSEICLSCAKNTPHKCHSTTDPEPCKECDIGKMCPKHPIGIALLTDSDWLIKEFDEKYKISDSTYFFDTVHEINESDISELKSFISKVASQARKEGYSQGIQEESHKCYEHSEQAKEAGKRELADSLKTRIGMLRQWLNEDRITNPHKMVTNEQIIHWLNKE